VVLVVICDRIGRTLGGLKLYSCLLTAVAVDFCNLVLGVEHGVDIAGLGVVWEASYEDERALEVELLGTWRYDGQELRYSVVVTASNPSSVRPTFPGFSIGATIPVPSFLRPWPSLRPTLAIIFSAKLILVLDSDMVEV
jgi:hypothetical protein